MTGNSTKYKNTSRIISGTTNFVFDNDVILLCDTSLGIVDLTLLDIPSGNFSTQYKLYIVDKSNNASVNNITIKAPTGLTVNNSATAVINVNNGVAVVTISSNTTYNVQYNYVIGGGGGNPLIIKNEGTVITPSATSIDFVGSPVNATAVGNDVTVDIVDNGGHPIQIENEGTTITPDVAKINFTGSIVNATAVGNDVTVDISLGFISVTYATLLTLIGSNSLVPTQQYLITDAIFTSTVLEQVAILVTAVTTNEISLTGSGIFLNADYQNIGNYSGVTGFVAQTGGYNLSGVYAIGDVAIYGNLQYVNISGANTGDPETTPVDWTLLSKSSTNGYITEIDIVKYDVSTNYITYREDVRNNRIENNFLRDITDLEAFYVFQWGNNKVAENTILGNSFFDIQYQLGTIYNNLVNNASRITKRTSNTGIISGNSFLLGAKVDIGKNDGLLNQNVFESCITMTVNNNGTSSSISQNIVRYGECSSIVNLADNGTIERNEFIHNVSCEPALNISNNSGRINANRFYQCGVININNNQGNFNNNISEDGAYWDVSSNTGYIGNNLLTQSGSIRVDDNQGDISYNKLYSGLINVATNTGSIEQNQTENQGRILLGNNSSSLIKNYVNGSDLRVRTENLGNVSNNTLKNESLLDLDNVLITSEVLQNNLDDGRLIINQTGTTQDCEGAIKENTILNSIVNILGGVTVTGTFLKNRIESGSTVNITQKMLGRFENNRMYEGSVFSMYNHTQDISIVTSNYFNSTSVNTDYINESFQYNELNDCSWIVPTNSSKYFGYNTWVSVMFSPFNLNASIVNTNINTAQFICPIFDKDVDGGIIQNGIGTTLYELDLNDPTIYNNVKGILTIPTCLQTFFGYFELQNGAGKVITGIENSSKRFPTTFFNQDFGTQIDFQVLSGVAGAGTNELVYNVSGGYPITLRLVNDFGVTDFIVIKRSYGDLNCIEQYQHYV
jgi:hypothetical protein